MKAEELRIGNWVYDLIESRFVKVSGIEVSQDEVWLNYANGSAQYIRYIGNVQPILLSEEVLLKCPEIKPCNWRTETWTIREPRSQFHLVKKDDRFVFRGLGMSVTYVDTLHHLQNLVYVVTCEELEVSL